MGTFSTLVSTIDAHTAGEPTRVVMSGLPVIPGDTMAEKKEHFRQHLDGYRKLLMHEPRGHKDMFGVVLTPATSPHAHFGVLFMDSSGYIDMCGHGIMSLSTVLLETGVVARQERESRLAFNTPAKRCDC